MLSAGACFHKKRFASDLSPFTQKRSAEDGNIATKPKTKIARVTTEDSVN